MEERAEEPPIRWHDHGIGDTQKKILAWPWFEEGADYISGRKTFSGHGVKSVVASSGRLGIVPNRDMLDYYGIEGPQHYEAIVLELALSAVALICFGRITS